MREWNRVVDLRQMRPPRLFTRFARDLAPSHQPLGRSALEAFLAASGLDGNHLINTQLGCFFDQQFEPMKLYKSDLEREAKGGLGKAPLFTNRQRHTFLPSAAT